MAVQVRQIFGCEMWQLKNKDDDTLYTKTLCFMLATMTAVFRRTQQWNDKKELPLQRVAGELLKKRDFEGIRGKVRRPILTDIVVTWGRNQCGTLGSHQVHLVVDTDLLMRVARKKGEHETLFSFTYTCHSCIHFATWHCCHASRFTCSTTDQFGRLNRMQ